ncbi:ADP/ATP carrier receptor [Suillus bovinus]|uniref:ADP/ATP carrier receptor n=1 Tax=Suillus bovinus TaxID=48563 RepID=UPI001B86A511|nr:ADP/ATP carrier receptor [Suillus bovinus]KAG2136574.1 ADP/ATP carrier receptor [Suillus bovinus]
MATTSSTSYFERIQDFVAENKKAVVIGTAAAALAVGGVIYYASTSRGPGGDLEKGKMRDKKKSSKKRKTVNDPDGPLLEEIKPKVTEEEDALSAEEIAGMSVEERTKLAGTLKTRGNTLYQNRKFQQAVDMYTRAIQVATKSEPVYYSNRAACYMNMTPPKYELAVQDCDEALRADPSYVKALNRRANALEALSRNQEALRDFTAATILDKFQNESAAQAVERVLKKIATEKAAIILSTREPRLPSFTFVSAYFAAFRVRPLPALPENPSTGDNTLILALQALEAADYAHTVSLVNEAMEQGISWEIGKAEALNLRGTFKFLMGDVSGAKEDLYESVKILPSLTQSWVKIASVHMEQGEGTKAFECFEEAIKHNPQDPDIYYHRGQVLFITNEFKEAADNYTKSSELDDTFVFSHIQLAVALYKMDELARSMATFRRTMTNFPQRSEPQNYYGELLLDQRRFADAVDKFDRAVELERAKPPPMNVLPLVNKGLAIYQWKQDIAAAEQCCDEALRIDSECEPAVATLAQLSLQQGKIDRAVEMFKRQAELARSEPELINALTYQYASTAQLEFTRNYPEMAEQLAQIARSMT